MQNLYIGDCLDVMQTMAPESVDLIYLDPPFNSGRIYNDFSDKWEFTEDETRAIYKALYLKVPELGNLLSCVHQINEKIAAYLAFMAQRLKEMHRLLKPTGSLYLHCDDSASSYLRVVLDCIFTRYRYRNQIIWMRTPSHNDSNQWGRIHDVLLYYTKSSKCTWNTIHLPYREDQLLRYSHRDKHGKYSTSQLNLSNRPVSEFPYTLA